MVLIASVPDHCLSFTLYQLQGCSAPHNNTSKADALIHTCLSCKDTLTHATMSHVSGKLYPRINYPNQQPYSGGHIQDTSQDAVIFFWNIPGGFISKTSMLYMYTRSFMPIFTVGTKIGIITANYQQLTTILVAILNIRKPMCDKEASIRFS